MSLYKPPGTSIWWVYLSHHGQRIRRTTRTRDKKEAQRFHDTLKAQLWQEQRGAGRRLSDAIKRWLTSAERSDPEKYLIKRFLVDYPDRPLDDCSAHDIDATLATYTVESANRTRTILKAAMALLDHPIKLIKRKGARKRLRWLTRDEWAALYAALPEHLKAPALFSIATGLRQSNAISITWEQIDLKRRVAWVDASDAKADKAISVPLSDDAVAALNIAKGEKKNPKGLVFKYRDGPIGKVKTAWQTAITAAGLGHAELVENDDGTITRNWVSDVTWHTLRHTWASWHVQAGTPLPVLKELGGWASMDMVMRYAHLAPDHVSAWANNARIEQSNEKAA